MLVKEKIDRCHGCSVRRLWHKLGFHDDLTGLELLLEVPALLVKAHAKKLYIVLCRIFFLLFCYLNYLVFRLHL